MSSRTSLPLIAGLIFTILGSAGFTAPVVDGDRATIALPGGVKIVLVKVPAGSFEMGAGPEDADANEKELPRHKVTISSEFWIGESEVTVGQFRAFVDATGYTTFAEAEGSAFGRDENNQMDWIEGANWRNPGFSQTEEDPVVNVSWYDATEFCQWLGELSGFNIALPTEAQWEYAARAGVQTAYLWGDGPGAADGWMNVREELAPNGLSWDDGYVFTAPVKSFRANDFGLYDIHGNVWEWIGSHPYSFSPEPRTDPAGPDQGTEYGIRGGSWFNDFSAQRLSSRGSNPPDFRMFLLGFRVWSDGTPWQQPLDTESNITIKPLEDGSYRVTFQWSPDTAIETAHIAGSFNEWSSEASPMEDSDGDGTWTVTMEFDGTPVQYKFVANGTEWFSDPVNPMTAGAYGNSLLLFGETKESVPAPDVPEWVRGSAFNYEIDSLHSSVAWELDYLGLAPFSGEFGEVTGAVSFDAESPENTKIHVSVPVESINTRNQPRDDYIRSADFLDSANWPEAVFTSSRTQRKNDDTWSMAGSLSMRGRAVPVEFLFEEPRVSDDRSRIAARAELTFDRTRWGMVQVIPDLGTDVTLDIIIHASRID